MSIETRVLPEKNTLLRTASGKLDIDAIIKAYDNAPSVEGYTKGMHIIWDLSNADVNHIQRDDIIRLVEYIRNHPLVHSAECKLAIVANSNLAFGLSKMFEGYGTGLPLFIHVFKNLDDANTWIDEEIEPTV